MVMQLKEMARSAVWLLFYGICKTTSHATFTGTAIETPMKVSVRLTVLKDKPYVKTPHFATRSPHGSAEEFYCTTGVDSGMNSIFYAAPSSGMRL